MALEDILRKRSKSTRSKKNTREEKNKTPTTQPSKKFVISEPEVLLSDNETPLPEHGTPLPEPEIPKKPVEQKKPESPKEKGIFFKEPVPPAKSTLAPTEGKGKEKMD